jgi:Tol biopolymer transport system component
MKAEGRALERRSRIYARFAPITILVFVFSWISFVMPAGAQVGTMFGKNKVEYKDFDWKYIQSPHFDVYFYQGGRELAEFCADHAEAALDSIERVLKYDITNRIAILVYNSHNDFQQTNAVGEFLPEGVGGVTELLKNRVVLPFEGDFELFRHVIHHELTHAVINDMFVGGTYQALLTGGGMEIPSWMNEGLAEYNSLHGLDIATDMFMRDAVLNDAVPSLARLGGYIQYRVGQTMYWYIDQRYGQDKVGELLNRIKQTRSVESGFRGTFGMGVSEFGDKFLDGLKKLYYPDIARYNDPNDFAESLADHKKLDDFMNVSPEVSPQGDQVAFISDRSGYYDIYVQSLTQPGKIKKILNGGGATANFEELHLLTPGLTWSPDGKRIALASKAGETDAIFLIDVGTTDQERLPNIDLDGVQGIKWSPDGKYIAIAGIHNGQSDIYLYDLEAKALKNITNDVFGDHEPTWAADSKSIYFTSEREGMLGPGEHPIARANGVNFESPNRDVYRYDITSNTITRITNTEGASEYYPAVSQDNHLFYISDANGINNVYEANADGSNAHPITNSVSKIDQISVSNDGTKLTFSAMHKGGYDLFLLRNPNARHVDSLGLTEFRRNNGGRLIAQIDTSLRGTTSDSTQGYGDVGVDLHDYVFNNTSSERTRREPKAAVEVVTHYKDSSGHYIAHNYRTVFSPDVIIGTAGYTSYYGLQGTTQMLFSDELGNQQIFFATNLILDLKNSDYLLAYYNLTHRTSWGIQGYHSAAFLQEQYDILPDGTYTSYPFARFTSTGIAGMASYPLNRFSRFDFGMTGAIFQKDLLVDVDVPTKNAFAIFPQINYVHDDALYSYFYPIGGNRINIGISAAPKLGSDWLGFVTPTIDARHYIKMTNTFSLATRFAGAASFGPTPQHFFIGGVGSWINYRYSTLGFPVLDPQDFAFFTPGLPLRGFNYDEKIGTHYAIANLELRYPFPIIVGGFPLAFFGDSFIDAGTAWNKQLYLFQRAQDGGWVTRDLLMSAGTGIRTYLFGFYVHMDIAWTTNIESWSHPNWLFSLGEDF